MERVPAIAIAERLRSSRIVEQSHGTSASEHKSHAGSVQRDSSLFFLF
jgi:hypothetical protein